MPPLNEKDLRQLSARYGRMAHPRLFSMEAFRAGCWGSRAPQLEFSQQQLAFRTIHELHEEGMSRGAIRRVLIARFREQQQEGAYGISPLLVISMFSLAINLIRLYLEWRREQS